MPSVSFKLNWAGCNIINLLDSNTKKKKKIKRQKNKNKKKKNKTRLFKCNIDDQ